MTSNAVSISVSGMNAASLQLNAAADNVANATTTGALPGSANAATNPVYRPEVVTFKQIGSGDSPAGVAAELTSTDNYYQTYQPTAPYADANGMVAAPAVDLAAQMVSALYAETQFAASAKVIQVAQRMTKSAIDMIA